jgi:hypothetical protein
MHSSIEFRPFMYGIEASYYMNAIKSGTSFYDENVSPFLPTLPFSVHSFLDELSHGTYE